MGTFSKQALNFCLKLLKHSWTVLPLVELEWMLNPISISVWVSCQEPRCFFCLNKETCKWAHAEKWGGVSSVFYITITRAEEIWEQCGAARLSLCETTYHIQTSTFPVHKTSFTTSFEKLKALPRLTGRNPIVTPKKKSFLCNLLNIITCKCGKS